MKKVMKIKILISVLSFFMILGFAPMNVHAKNPNNLIVNGTDIINVQNNTMNCGNGTARYDSTINTLILNNATINSTNLNYAAIYCLGGDLTIKLIGENTITSTGRGIYLSGYTLNFEGDGSLEIVADGEAIQADGSNIVIDGCTMDITTSTYGGIQVYGNSDLLGKLTIKNGADITINSPELAIVGQRGISIIDSNVNAIVSNNNTNVLYSKLGKITISNSTVKATETANNPYPTIWGYEIWISQNSNVTASTTGSNAIYSPNTLNVINSSLIAESPGYAVKCKGSINISNSTIKAISTDENVINPSIVSQDKLNISNSSDVIAEGGITATNGMTVTPANGKLVEFKAGTYENGVVGAIHRGSSPYSTEFSFKNDDRELDYTYIHIKNHIHAGGTANCKDGAICIDCEKSYGNLNPDNHKNLVKKAAKAATHLSEGNIEYYYCDGCGKYFRDKNGVIEISLANTVISKISEHTVDDKGWHFDDESHWNTCECGEILNRSTHTFIWIVDNNATKNEQGKKHEECEVCGYKKASIKIPALETNQNDNNQKTDKDNNKFDTGNAIVKTGDDNNMMFLYMLLH